jgi:hypothetical protein
MSLRMRRSASCIIDITSIGPPPAAAVVEPTLVGAGLSPAATSAENGNVAIGTCWAPGDVAAAYDSNNSDTPAAGQQARTSNETKRT